jgi:carboxymethylenebutenolidase
MMKAVLFVGGLVAACLAASSSFVPEMHAGSRRSVLPSDDNAKTLLAATTRHREWVAIGAGAGATLAFVVYPERAERAPVVLVTAGGESAGVRARAIGDQLAAEGFISITPDTTGAAAYGAARSFAAQLPAADGRSAWLDIDVTRRHAQVTTESSGIGHFALSTEEWPHLIEHLSRATGNMFAAAAQQAHGSEAARMIPGLANKVPGLPAAYYTATKTLADSRLKREYVDIPLGDVKLHTWVEYPARTNKTGVVIVMQHGVGLDDWMRSVADQIAADGFIAVAPDAWSGTGPNGGNRDSFQFDDDAMRAAARITPDETQRRYKAAREWALKLPRANGKTGSIGFCAGGGNSFRFAGEVPELNAAVVFYGTPPTEELVKKINAPVLAFYGENDARVTATAEPTVEVMKRFGKSFEPHVYPKVTHSFVYFQDLSVNRDAVADAWPRVVAFYDKYLK